MSAIFGFTGSPDHKLQDALNRSLAHRGGDSCFASVENLTVGLRRRIVTTQHPPIAQAGDSHVARGALSLTVAGRISGVSPEQTLIEIQRRGLDTALATIRGAFILLWYDAESGILRIVRDPAGERSVYYGWHAGRLIFASEPAAVRQAPGFPRRLRAAAVGQYLSFSFVPGYETMLEDLFELPAGHYLELNTRERGARPTLVRYFRLEDFEHHAITGERTPDADAAAIQAFRANLEQCVAERLEHRATDPGIFLSGGLDSSLVAATVRRMHAGPVRTYALHFGRKYPNELSYARSVADRIGSVHREIEIRPRAFLRRLWDMVGRLGEPIGDPVTIGNFELAREVSREVEYVFNGEGGDPCFGGPKNIPMMLSHWYGTGAAEARRRARTYLGTYQRCYEELPGILSPEFARNFDPAAHLEDLLVPFFDAERPTSFLKKLLAINIRLKGAHLILPKVERMTGAWGLESLAPLFDRRMIETAMALPSHLILDRGVEKIALKRAFAAELPPEIIERPKSGMRVPVYFWFRGELKSYARKILHPREIRRAGIFNEHRVKQLLQYDIEEGAGRFGIRLWILLTFEIWRRIVIEGERG